MQAVDEVVGRDVTLDGDLAVVLVFVDGDGVVVLVVGVLALLFGLVVAPEAHTPLLYDRSEKRRGLEPCRGIVSTRIPGRTGVDGLYAAGRLAEKPHQAAVCAGHGAEVAVALLEDDDRPFYHDWVAPEGYFTDRGRDLPPGCEEIDEAERAEREAASLETVRERFAEPHPDEQVTHPSLRDESTD